MKNVYLLPTEKPSRLVQRRITKEIKTSSLDNPQLWNNINIYITSYKEIQDGDWCYDIIRETIWKKSKNLTCNGSIYKKIILTTDRDLIKDGVQAIDDDLLNYLYNNPNCEYIETYSLGVENVYTGESGHYKYEVDIPQEEQESFNEKRGVTEVQLKDPNNCEHYKEFGCIKGICSCYILKHKQETIEEAAENFLNNSRLRNYKVLFIEGAKSDAAKDYWFKIFQEQEAYKIVHDLMVDINLNGLVINDDIDLKKWFEQFSKLKNER